MSVIGIAKLWSSLSPILHMPPDDIRTQLSLIVDRRNKIAHEADRNDLGNAKNTIDLPLIENCLDFIEKLCEGIAQLVEM